MLQVPFENKFFFISGLLQGLGSLVGGVVSGTTSLQATRETNQANRQLAEYAYGKELEQWNRENEYNSPVAQMARLKQAGLNPNLIYGDGNAVKASANSPSYQTPKMQAWSGSDFGITNAVNNYLNGEAIARNTEKIVQETNNLGTQREFTRAQIEALYLDMANKEIKNARDKFDYEQAVELRDTVIATAKSGLDKINSDIAVNQQKIIESQENVKLIAEKANLTSQEARRVTSDIERIASIIALNNSTIAYQEKQGLYVDAQRELVNAQRLNVDEDTDAKRFTNNINSLTYIEQVEIIKERLQKLVLENEANQYLEAKIKAEIMELGARAGKEAFQVVDNLINILTKGKKKKVGYT